MNSIQPAEKESELRALRRLMVLRVAVVVLVMVLIATFRDQMLLIDPHAPALFYLLVPLLLPMQWLLQAYLPWPLSSRVGLTFVVDMVLITLLMTATGGLLSPFPGLFALVLIAAAPFCNRVMVLALTVVAAAGFVLSAYATAWWLHLSMAPLSPLHILLQVSLLFLVGGVIAAVVERHSRLRHAHQAAEQGRAQVQVQYDEVVRRLVAQEKLAALGSMAAMLAHEIRNPLQTIGQAVELLGNSPPAVMTQLQTAIHQEVERLNRLVTSMLQYASPLQPSSEPCNPEALLAASLAQMTADDAVTVTIDCAVTECMVDADHFRLVVDNLLRNALLHASPGSEVRISMRPLQGKRWELVVQDQGGGISMEMMPKLFEPFVTGRKSGTGLGLAMVKQVCDANGWQVRVENRDGGARFVVTGVCNDG